MTTPHNLDELAELKARVAELEEALEAVDKTLFIGTTFTDEPRMRLAIESAHDISSTCLRSASLTRGEAEG